LFVVDSFWDGDLSYCCGFGFGFDAVYVGVRVRGRGRIEGMYLHIR
jgi:hypothetical protein